MPDKEKHEKKAKKQEGGKKGKKKDVWHPTFNIGNDITIRAEARIESAVRAPTPEIGFDDTTFAWGDRRVGIEGTAYKRFQFELSNELSDEFGFTEAGESGWKDAYVKTRFTKAFILGGGRFKEPFGRDQLTSESNLDFIYRSFAGRVLSPGRDVGVMAEGRLFDRLVEYQASYFTRDGDNSRTDETDGGTDAIVGRIVVSPFARTTDRPWLAPLQVGVATANSQLDDRLGLRGRTSLGDNIFFDRVYVNGRRQRLGFEGQWEYGPASLTTEYITVTDQRKGMGFSGEDLSSVHAATYYVAGTYALTGEHKHGRIDPHKNLFRGGFGAVEVAARVERLRFDTVDYPGSPFGFPTASKLLWNADTAITLGVNWYLNPYLKLQTNFVTESIADPDRGPSTTGNRFNSTVFRIQFRL